jgi:cell division protease FtsH
MKRPTFLRHILWAFLTLIIVAGLYSLLFHPADAPTRVSLNEVVAKMNADEVETIKVQGDNLTIRLKNGSNVKAQKETEAGLSETLKNLGASQEALQRTNIEIADQSGWQYWAGIILPALLPVLLIAFLFWYMFRQAKGGVNQAFTFGRSNLKLSGIGNEKVLFSDVAGLKEAKEELTEVVEFLRNPQKFTEIGARIPRGVLLAGSPGTGKTLLARAVAGESRVPFFHISASEFVEMFVGVGASRIRDAFMTARKAAPAILFVDEIDAVGRHRGAGMGSGNDEREQTLNQILVELDGFDRETRVIVLAATNRPDILDPALLRPGRFDRRVVLDLPDRADREAILKIHARGKKIAKNVDFARIAARTPGYSGADLANLVNEAAILAARGNRKEVAQEDMYEAVEKVILGPERRTRIISPEEKKKTAYHEGGHALVAASVKGADPVHKISIISRGMAGGYTMNIAEEENRLRTKSQFLADIARMLGGFAAEKLVFGEVSTGASNDLQHATDLARHMVTKYGMSDLGPLTFGKDDELMFLGRDIARERNYSESVAQKIDAEVSRFVQAAYGIATKMLKTHKKALDKVAATLIEKETLEKEEFYAVLKPFKIKPAAFSV